MKITSAVRVAAITACGLSFGTTAQAQTEWTKYPGNPVIASKGCCFSWDSSEVSAVSVLRDGDIYRMWYVGAGGMPKSLGYATSPDGVVWTKYAGNPVIASKGCCFSWDSSEISAVSVLK